MKVLPFLLLVTTISILAISSCKKETSYTPDCSGATKSFATDVQPLMQTKCANSVSCHAAGSGNGPGQLSTYAQVSAAASDIKSQVSSGAMPKGSSLSDAQKDIIICWINDGAQNN